MSEDAVRQDRKNSASFTANNEHSKLGVEMKEHARIVRDQWSSDIADGTRSVMEAVTFSGPDAKYILKIPLVTILRKMEGWTVHTAKNALVSSGISVNTKLGRLAQSRRELADFEDIVRGAFQRWIPNITYPDGYPFFGKIEDVLAQADVSAFMPEQPGDADTDAEDDGSATSTVDDGEAVVDSEADDEDDADDRAAAELNDLLAGLDLE